MNQVVNRLKAMNTKITAVNYTQLPNEQSIINSDNVNISLDMNNSLIYKFDQVEKESTTIPIKQIIDGNILDLSIVTDELVNLIFKEMTQMSEGKNKEIRKQHILDHIDNHRIIPQEFYN